MLSPHANVCEKWHCSQNVPPHAKPAGAGDALSSTADALRFSLASHAACITSCLDTQARPSALSTRSLSIRCTFARSREAAAPSAFSTRSLNIRCVFPRCITAFLPSSKRRDEAAGAAVTAEARGTGGAEDFPAAAVSRAPVSYHEATRAASNRVTQTNSAKPTDARIEDPLRTSWYERDDRDSENLTKPEVYKFAAFAPIAWCSPATLFASWVTGEELSEASQPKVNSCVNPVTSNFLGRRRRTASCSTPPPERRFINDEPRLTESGRTEFCQGLPYIGIQSKRCLS